jgi:hypothetical protein
MLRVSLRCLSEALEERILKGDSWQQQQQQQQQQRRRRRRQHSQSLRSCFCCTGAELELMFGNISVLIHSVDWPYFLY